MQHYRVGHVNMWEQHLTLTFLFFAGFEHSRQTEVSARTEPAARERRKGPVSARPLRHRDSSAASVHPGDQDQEHDLQNQTQAGLHTLSV